MEPNTKKFNEVQLSKFQARYGKNIEDNTSITNEFIEQVLSRKTIRRFKNQIIDEKIIEKLLAVAQSSPTSSMLQPWSVIFLSKEKRKILYNEKNIQWLGVSNYDKDKTRSPADLANFTSLKECSHFIIWCADYSILHAIMTDPSIDDLHPDLKSLKINALTASYDLNYSLRSIIDTTIAAQTFSLAAESIDLGVQYMGSIRNMYLKEDLNLPDRVLPLFGMCVGYPYNNNLDIDGLIKNNNKVTHAKPRLPQELISHKDTYKPLNYEKIKEYNELMKEFYQYNNLKKDWFYRVIDRTSRLIPGYFRDLAKKYNFGFR